MLQVADPHMYRCQTLEAWHIKNLIQWVGLLVYHSLIRTHPPPDTVDNLALSSLIHFHYPFLPTRELCSLPVVFVFIPAAPLLVLFATDEDYCIVIETFGFHILS